MERKGRMSIQWRWPRREKLNRCPGENLECADCRASKRMFWLRNFCLCFDFGDEILEHFGLLFFFYKTAQKKLLWSWVCRRLLRDTLGFRGMFQLDFCLWVSRFQLFIIELHTILVQGIYEKSVFFGGEGNPECAEGSCETHWDSVGMFRLGGRQPKKPPGN